MQVGKKEPTPRHFFIAHMVAAVNCVLVASRHQRPEVYSAMLSRRLRQAIRYSTLDSDGQPLGGQGRVKEILEGRSCELLCLPPYSPDSNLIEQTFSKVKG